MVDFFSQALYNYNGFENKKGKWRMTEKENEKRKKDKEFYDFLTLLIFFMRGPWSPED